MNINWYPGHMKKTRELLQSNLKLVDVVYELLDSRIPISSKNPEIDKIIGDKPRIVLLNKSDLSDPKLNKEWMAYFKDTGASALLINASQNSGTKKIFEATREIVEEKLKRLESRGIKNKTIRAMIVGIPNVGKSTLINALSGRKSAKTGNRPGVTKGKQWIKLKGNIELLDTPGILWPKFEDKNVAMNLAFTGAIKDEIMDIETLALRLIEKLMVQVPEMIETRYKIEIKPDMEPLSIMDDIARMRGCIVRGGDVDYTRVAHLILDEFRRGTIGQITLDIPTTIE